MIELKNFSCDKSRHIKRDSPTVAPIVCYSCGEVGHIHSKCPVRSELCKKCKSDHHATVVWRYSYSLVANKGSKGTVHMTNEDRARGEMFMFLSPPGEGSLGICFHGGIYGHNR